jgi:hypothetical protein
MIQRAFQEGIQCERAPQGSGTGPLFILVPLIAPRRSPEAKTVCSAMTAILGSPPTQSELLGFRANIFQEVMPRPGRAEKRQRNMNIQTFERYKLAVLPLLATPHVCAQMLNIALQSRSHVRRERMLMNCLGI